MFGYILSEIGTDGALCTDGRSWTQLITMFIYIKSTTVYVPSPNPSLASECAPPPGTMGGGGHTRAGKGLGESQFQQLEKKLSTLLTLWS